MSTLKINKFVVLSLLIFANCLCTFHQQATGQTIGPCGYATGTLNLPTAPANLQVIKTYKKTSELFFTLPEGKTIADLNSYDYQHMEPMKRIERVVYSKDSLGVDVVLKHVLDPEVQFKPTIEPYELMVLYPTSVEIYNRNGIKIYSTDLDTTSYVEENGEQGGQGSQGGGSLIDSNEITITSIEGDSVFKIEGPNFVAVVNIPKGLFVETVYDDYDLWIEKEIAFYDPGDEDRSRPLLELNISRDTLPISGECVFRVISTAYEEYCSVDSGYSSRVLILEEVHYKGHLTMTKWPNPVSSMLNILIESGNGNEMVEIEIIDLEGKILYSAKANVNQRFTIDVSAFRSGLYLMKAQSGRDMIVERVVIQN
ncbi:MAG: T9SS C-terminal target domain-containing protein [Saprospirales bacterium]|nr:MAG: T9SS C-terminal target domain-containing protein [Saprospirales bacterium]